jgi:hypothetical protein
MASYPGSKVHRSSRRKLGRGQHVQLSPAIASLAASTSTVTITFNVGVIVSGAVNLHLSTGGPLVSQAQTSPTTVVQHYTSSVVGATWSITPNEPVATFQGGGLATARGTF